jgi:hypothetical protein
MKATIRILGICFASLLIIGLFDRLILNPRPLSGVGKAALILLTVGTLLWAASLVALRTRFASTVSNVWLAVISSMIAYSAIDIVGGVVFIRPLSPAIVSDAHTHHRLKSDKVSYIETTEYAYLQHVNHLGLRGPDIDSAKAHDTFRILMLGDSFTMGKGVADSETFSHLLEISLNRSVQGTHGPKIEVINGGVDSYAPILSSLQLMQLAPVISPDLVVLNFDMSDLLQEQAYRSLAIKDTDGVIVAVPAQQRSEYTDWDTVLGRFIDQHLFVTRLITQRIRAWTMDPDRPTVADTVVASNLEVLAHTLSHDTANRERQWSDIFDSILSIQRYCSERQIIFLLTAYPWGHQVSEREWADGRTNFMPNGAIVSDRSLQGIEDFARANSVHFTNLFPALRGYRGDDRLYFTMDMHWTPAGHRVVAASLDGALRQFIPWQQ